MTTKIYEVCYQDYDDFGTDSFWFSKEKAEVRLEEIREQQKKDRRNRNRNVWGTHIAWQVVEHETEDDAPLVIPKSIFDRLDALDDEHDLDPAIRHGIGEAWNVLREFCKHDYQPRVNGGSTCTKCRHWVDKRF